MPVTSTTLAGVNVWRLSGNVTDAELKTAWAGIITNNRYLLARAIYVDDTCSLNNVRGTYYIDSQNLGIILHLSRNKANTLFRNWFFTQTVGLSVGNRSNFVRFTNGTTITNSVVDGIDMQGGGMMYAVVGNPGGGDPRFLNEMMFGSLNGTLVTSSAWTEQEIEPTSIGTIWRGLNNQKTGSVVILSATNGSQRQVIYRSNFNTEGATLRLIRPFFNNSICLVSTVVRRLGATVTSNLGDTFGSTGSGVIMLLNNFTDESYFGASKTTLPFANWNAGNRVIGGVLKKIKVQPSTLIRTYDSRSTTVSQKSTFSETTNDFLDGTDATTSDAVSGNAQIVCIGAIATGSSINITRFTGQRFTLQKFGFRVQVEIPDMTFGDDDLSAFSPITMAVQDGISRTQSAINSATEINNFQELLEELHVLAIGLQGAQSYNGFANGNLFNFSGGVLTTNFTNVNVDATASSKIAYNPTTNTLTIKSSVLASNSVVSSWNNAIGSINTLNGALVTGIYTTSVGTSTIWEFGNDLDPIEVGTSLAIYDNAGVTKYFQQVTSEGVYRYYIAPQAVGETFTYAIEKYGTRRESGTFPSNAGGILFYVPSYGEDVGITELNRTTVAAYTTLSDTAQIYDATANFRLTETGIKLGQLVARDGTFLDFGNLNVKIKDDASAIVSVASGTITYKALVVNSSDKYNAMKATPPKTITVTDNELINVLIEDANGDSQVSILGGDNLGYELWKVTTATPTDDYATGTLLTTLATNALPYRFIGITGFDIVGRDVSSGVRRRSSMLKGSYTQAFYVGDQIQLATNAPQLIENNEKLDELILKIDTNLDEKISTRLAEIDYVAPDNPTISDIKTKVDTLENTDLTGIATAANVTDAKDEIITEIQAIDVDLTGVALETTSQELITKVDAIQTTVDNIDVDFTPVLDAIDTKPTLAEIEASTVLASAENVTDAVTDIHNDLVKLNEGIKKASKIELYTDDL